MQPGRERKGINHPQVEQAVTDIMDQAIALVQGTSRAHSISRQTYPVLDGAEDVA